MTLAELRANKNEILKIVQEHGGLPAVRVFGSIARGVSGASSDVDLLVELKTGGSLLDRAEMQIELEDFLGVKVDVVSPKGLYWAFREEILSEAVPL